MPEIGEKVKNALDEARMLVLGTQVLIGFQLKQAFDAGFSRLPPASQNLSLFALTALVVTMTFLMSPAAYHQIVERGEPTEDLNDFSTRVATIALVPLGLAFAVTIYVAVAKVAGVLAGVAAAAGTVLFAAAMWFGIELFQHRRSARPSSQSEESSRDKRLEFKIEEVLTEARVVLPGAQALLGFQLIAVLAESFERLPQWLQFVHLASLGFIAISTILLMTPAAYHRLAEHGENSERFHRFASRILLAAMLVLPLGVCGDVFVVVHKVTDSLGAALGIAGGLLCLCYGLWFAYPALAAGGIRERTRSARNRRASLS